MSTIIQNIEREQLRKGIPEFDPGDRVRVHFQVIEGNRRRTQVFEGVVLRRQGAGARETFTVRKQSFGVGVERTFPLHSPKIEQLEVAARGDVRRAKLYYLRDRVGKAARVTERRWAGAEDLQGSAEAEPVPAEEPTEDIDAPPAEDAAHADEPTAEDAATVDVEADEASAAEEPAEDAPAEDTAADAEEPAAEADEAGGGDAEAGEADERTG